MPFPDRPLILIVDDDSGIRSVLRLLLERERYHIEEAATGQAAVAAFSQLQPDIILMDIRMPVMDGAAACAEIQKLPNGQHTPVLMITALDDRESIDRSFEAGATDYLTKPINNAVLRQRVRRLIRARQAEDALRDSEARLASIIEISADAILLIDAELNIRLFNRGAERIFGYTAAEAIGQSIEFLMPDWFRPMHTLRLNETGRPLVGQITDYREGAARRKDGSIFPIEVAVGAIEEKQRTAFTVTLRDITRRKEAEAEIKRRVEQLAALGQIGQAVTTRLDLTEVLKTLIDEVMSRLEAEGVSVLLREGAADLIFAAVNGIGAEALRGQRIPANAGVAGWVLQERQATRISNDADRARIYRPIERFSQYHAQDLIAAPLTLGPDVIGVMEAVHSRRNVFTDDDVRLVAAAASWAAIAIANARQHQSLQRRLRESEAMAAIGRALNETLELSHVLQLIVTSVRDIIPEADQAAILLLDTDHDTVQLVTEDGQQAHRMSDQMPHLQQDEYGQRLMRGEIVRVSDLQLIGEQPRPLGVPPDVRSLLGAPVRGGEQIFGIISVLSRVPNAFAGDDERLLRLLGDEAAIAIQNARLYASEHTQRQWAEALRDTAASLTGTLDLDEVLDRILDYAERVVPHDSAHIMLTESGVAQIARCRGYADDQCQRLLTRRFSVIDTRPLRLISESQQLLIDDTWQFDGWGQLPDAGEVRSFVGAAIRFKRKLLGFIGLESKTPGFFTPDAIERLQVFANQAAVAIENARLYQLELEQFQQWQTTQAKLAETEKMGALGRLAAALAQEISAPLQSIEQHLNHAITAGPASLEGLEVARRETERLHQLARNVLAFTRPEKETHRAVSVNELVEQALAQTQRFAEKYHTVITTDLQPTPPIWAAPSQLVQAVFNVVLNAIEAANQRGQVHVVTRAEDGQVSTLVIDDGPPIRADDLTRVFEPFFSKKPGGTGLGLTVSHALVRQHGGTLTVENLTNDRGVVVTLKLPTTPSAMAAI